MSLIEIGSFEEFCLFPDGEPEVCKGLIFRASNNWFENSNGDFEYRVKFRRLIRKSCPGCSKCLSVLDSAHELMENVIFPLEPKNGGLYQLKITNVHTDWETGYVDDWDTEFVEYEE